MTESMDFNDIHQKQGPEAVREQVNAARSATNDEWLPSPSDAPLPEEPEDRSERVYEPHELSAASDGHGTGKQQGQTSTPTRRRLQPYTVQELQSLPDIEYLIKDVIPCNGLSVMRGPSNCGKTFDALDKALHIALSWKWRGRKTRQGKVIYVAAESGLSIKRRVQAFMKHYGLEDIPDFHLLPKGVNFCSTKEDAEEIIKEINILGGVALVIIDTLSRAMAGGDENGPKDMGAFVMNCDLIRQETKGHVMVIHHTGKNVDSGARGHSCLLAAVDTEFAVTDNDGIITVEITKQRDGGKGEIFSSEMKVIQLGIDDEDKPITSCVLIPMDEPAGKREKPLTGRTKDAFQILCNLIVDHGKKVIPKKDMSEVMVVPLADFREALKAGDIADGTKGDSQKQAIKRAIRSLKNANKIKVWKSNVWITGDKGT